MIKMYGVNLQRLLPVFLLLCCIVRDIESTITKQFNIGKDCDSYEHYYVGEQDTIEVVWDDEKVPSTCTLAFKGGPFGDYDNEYKVCIKASEFEITDCNVKLIYYFSALYTTPDKSYSCKDFPTLFCSEPKDYLYVELKDNTIMGNFYPGSKFKLLVTAVKTYDHSDYVAYIGGIVGGVLGGIAVLTVIGIVVCICICNRKRTHRKGHVYNPGQSGQPNMNTTSTTGQNSGQSLPMSAYPRQTYPYPTQQYPTEQQSTIQSNETTSGLKEVQQPSEPTKN